MSESNGWGEGGNYALPRPSGKRERKEISLVPLGKKDAVSPGASAASGRSSASAPSAPSAPSAAETGGGRGGGALPLPKASPVSGAAPVAAPLGVPVAKKESPLPVPRAGESPLPSPRSEERRGTGLPVPRPLAEKRAEGDLLPSGAPVGEGASEGVKPAAGKGGEALPSGRPKKGRRAPKAVGPLMGTDEGWDEDNPALVEADPELDKKKVAEYVTASRGVRITERDINIIRFLARFRYAQGVQVARYVDSSEKAIDQRLTKLGKAGFLRREDVTRGQSLWTPTAWGLSMADLDFRAIGEGKISYVTIAHTLGLVNIGVELETGKENLLGEEVWPQENRLSLVTGELLPGEVLVTEREIRQGQSRWKKSGMARRDSEQAFSLSLSQWLAGDRTEGTPELEVGNEAMLILWATKAGRSDHIPDLVVARPRHDDGTPGSYAVELELNAKPLKEWTRILSTYYEARDLYAQVHYFTHKKSIADSLNKIAEDVGLTQEGRFFMHRYVPRQSGLPFWG